MGIITRTSKAPPVPSYTPPVTIIREQEPVVPARSDEEIAAETRRENLLRRSRSRLGTVLTGFKGFLTTSATEETSGRKTLLGE